jgi:hypothetical protein
LLLPNSTENQKARRANLTGLDQSGEARHECRVFERVTSSPNATEADEALSEFTHP